MSLDNVKPAMLEYASLTAAKREIEARLKELGAVIRPVLEGRGSVIAEEYIFECRMNKGRVTLDKKALVASGVDVAPFEKTGAPFTTLTVKAVETA